MEELWYEAESVRRFTGLRLAEPIPDASTILHFHHLLEKHDLGQGLFTEIQGHLKEQGVRLQEGRNHRGRHHHCRAVVHQESCQAAGPRDAAGEEVERLP